MERLDPLLAKMEKDWDARARKNARYYVNTDRAAWTDEEFFRSGQCEVDEQILSDMGNICQGKDPRRMSALEIGCGAGRVTRALSLVFGEVHGVDVSGEMVRQAQAALADRPNVFLYKNSGADLAVLGERRFDFAFSMLVFQHIPSREVIETYLREVSQRLVPGGLFKCQLQGDVRVTSDPDDTWVGASFSAEQAAEMGRRCGLEMRYSTGAGEQYFWAWYFKR